MKYIDGSGKVRTLIAERHPFKGVENYFTDSLLYQESAEIDEVPQPEEPDSGKSTVWLKREREVGKTDNPKLDAQRKSAKPTTPTTACITGCWDILPKAATSSRTFFRL